jgi:hypothetical protein
MCAAIIGVDQFSIRRWKNYGLWTFVLLYASTFIPNLISGILFEVLWGNFSMHSVAYALALAFLCGAAAGLGTVMTRLGLLHVCKIDD